MTELSEVKIDSKVRLTVELEGEVLQSNPEYLEIRTADGRVAIGRPADRIKEIQVLDDSEAIETDSYELEGVPLSRLRAERDALED